MGKNLRTGRKKIENKRELKWFRKDNDFRGITACSLTYGQIQIKKVVRKEERDMQGERGEIIKIKQKRLVCFGGTTKLIFHYKLVLRTTALVFHANINFMHTLKYILDTCLHTSEDVLCILCANIIYLYPHTNH